MNRRFFLKAQVSMAVALIASPAMAETPPTIQVGDYIRVREWDEFGNLKYNSVRKFQEHMDFWQRPNGWTMQWDLERRGSPDTLPS